MPRRFFEEHVRPNYEEWLSSPLNERLAKNALADANNMAARVFHYWRDRDPAQVYGVTNEARYRDLQRAETLGPGNGDGWHARVGGLIERFTP